MDESRENFHFTGEQKWEKEGLLVTSLEREMR